VKKELLPFSSCITEALWASYSWESVGADNDKENAKTAGC